MLTVLCVAALAAFVSCNGAPVENSTISILGGSSSSPMIDNSSLTSMIPTFGKSSWSAFCAGLPDGLYANTNFTYQREACEQYILCANTVEYLLYCPIGYAFNVDKNQCEPVGLVERPCGLKIAPLSYPLPSCIGKDSSMLVNDPTSCRKYWACTNTSTVQIDNVNDNLSMGLNCSKGMSFDEKKQTCVLSDLVDGCSPKSEPALAEFCKMKGTGLFADPKSCARGIVCLKNTYFYYTCGGWPSRMTGKIGRLFFSPDTLECVHEKPKTCSITA